jgi:acetyl-CoA carboxylase biotin carboxyl carrier protein
LAKKDSNKPARADEDNDQPRATRRGSGGPMDLGLLEQITRLMKENDLNTVDVRDGDKRVILKRGAVVAPNASPGFLPVPQIYAPNPGGAPGAQGGAGATPGATDESANLTAIKSPMVGTFYSAPSPDAKPFVTVGSEVDEDTDVCIIEAMKVFNNIKAECRGTITKVMINSGETVEFGQVLFLVKPA